MADTAEDARRYARTMREIKLHGVADAMDNYAALLTALKSCRHEVRDVIETKAEEIRSG